MSEEILSFAGALENAGAPPTVEPVVTPTDDDVDKPIVGDADGVDNDADKGADDGKDTDDAADKGESDKSDKTDKDQGKVTPSKVSAALKAFRDADPANAAVARELNDSYGRWNAAKQVFPGGVTEMKGFKAKWDVVGGDEGIASLQNVAKSVEATDQALYNAKDDSIIKQLDDDAKAAGHPDAIAKLGPHYVNYIQKNHPAAYQTMMMPHLIGMLGSVQYPEMVNAIHSALSAGTPNVARAKELLAEMARFYNDSKKQVGESGGTKHAEKEAWEVEKETAAKTATKEFQTSVAKACDSTINQLLGESLKGYLKMPFFKGFSKDSLLDLGDGLKRETYKQLKANTTYQSQMNALWGAAKPDKAKIEAFHKSTVDTIAAKIVKSVVERRYPGFRGGKAAGAKASADVVADKGTPVQTTASYIVNAPKHEDIDWSKDPKQMLFITDKAYLKKGGKLVTWNKKFAPKA